MTKRTKYLLLLLAVLLPFAAYAQNRRSVSRLEANAEFRPPVKTDCTTLTRQREGDQCWDSDDDALYLYNGSAFVLSFTSANVGTTTWGSGSAFTWTFDTAALDASLVFSGTGTIAFERASTAQVTFYLGDTDSNGVLVLFDDNGNELAIDTVTDISSGWTLTLPPDNGDADEFLLTDGSGNTTWNSLIAGAGIDVSGTGDQTFVFDATEIGVTADSGILTWGDNSVSIEHRFDHSGVGATHQAVFYQDSLVRFTSPGGSLGTTLAIGTTAANGDGILRLHDDDAGGDSDLDLIVPDAMGTSWDWTLPPDDGVANEFLQTNGSGVSVWAPAIGETDNANVGAVVWCDIGSASHDTGTECCAIFLMDCVISIDLLATPAEVACGSTPTGTTGGYYQALCN